MKVAVSGSSGLIGSALVAQLREHGHKVIRLIRRGLRGDALPDDAIGWNPETGVASCPTLSGINAVVHLAGESLVSVRWTRDKRRRIRDSRTIGTAAISRAFADLDEPPGVFISASAVGYYGNRGDELLTEESEQGSGFLADVCAAWEYAAHPAMQAGVRVVHPRFGAVLSTRGGALPMMLPVFRVGLGGKLGTGRQYMPWIGLQDAVSVLEHAIVDESLQGPVNVVAPDIVTNAEFTTQLSRVLGRPAFLAVPEIALRAALGHMAKEMLLSSQRAIPVELERSGFIFRHPSLREALAALV